MRKIVGLFGKKGSGKTVVAKHMTTRGYKRMSMADPMRDMLRAINIGDEYIVDDKTKVIPTLGKTGRYALQTLGTEWGRDLISEDIWVNAMKRRLTGGDELVVIDDIRFPNEADMIQDIGGTLCKITRPSANNIDTHGSESHYGDMPFDYEIINDRDLWYLVKSSLTFMGDLGE